MRLKRKRLLIFRSPVEDRRWPNDLQPVAPRQLVRRGRDWPYRLPPPASKPNTPTAGKTALPSRYTANTAT